MASAGPYASLHLAPDSEHPYTPAPTTLFLQAGCPSCRPTNSLKTHIVSCFSKIQIGFYLFLYRLTRVVPDKGPLNGCVCVLVAWCCSSVFIRYKDVICTFMFCFSFSALMLLVGWLEGHPACKNWVVGCWCGYLSGARCRLAYGPADATATHCLLLQ